MSVKGVAIKSLRRAIGCCVLTLAVTALSAAAASASTFYVATGGNDANACTAAVAPCKTIAAAVAKSGLVVGSATIEVGPGIYTEPLLLENSADDGITINGAGSGAGGTEISGFAKAASPTVRMSLPGSGARLSNLSVVNPAEDTQSAISVSADAILDNVVVSMRAASKAPGIESSSLGSITMSGGAVVMESGSEGPAIASHLTPLTLNGTAITVAPGATSGGVVATGGTASLTNTTIALGPNSQSYGVGVELASASLSNVSIVQEGAGPSAGGLALFLPEPASINGVRITMANAANAAVAVRQALGAANFERLEVGGAWTGPAYQSEGGQTTLADSRLVTSPAGIAFALAYVGFGEGPGLLVQRSVVQAAPTAVPGALLAINGSVALDSSELLGGTKGIFFQHGASKQRTLTVASSTIDAGNLGIADGPGVPDIEVGVGGSASVANVSVAGSILLEPQRATVGPGGNSANISCSYSDVPSQTQAASGTEGSIECANGTSGNTSSAPAALFSAPLTSYQLNPSSSAVDSVPAGTVRLPFGTISNTDLAGNPRTLDGNGDCVAVLDRGALELQGHAAACPAIIAPPHPALKPVAGVISALTINPRAFFAAPSGATVSAAGARARRKYGATIAYRDSQAATTTFTVVRESGGRRQGRSCRTPSRSNRHGRRCTLVTTLGTFTHVDVAGADSLRFSGRLHGRRLASGAYRLRAVARNAAGSGATVGTAFSIR